MRSHPKNDIYSCQMRLLGGTPYIYTSIYISIYISKSVSTPVSTHIYTSIYISTPVSTNLHQYLLYISFVYCAELATRAWYGGPPHGVHPWCLAALPAAWPPRLPQQLSHTGGLQPAAQLPCSQTHFHTFRVTQNSCQDTILSVSHLH